ncbi:MAG: hypothetical protein HY060_05310 [Proteobacteria bacterium]|nr:hypothetical protein [Pseudomonadota bacterium]
MTRGIYRRPAGVPPEDLELFRLYFDTMCVAGPEQRAQVAEKLISIRRAVFESLMEAIAPEAERTASTLATEGIVDLGVLVEPARVAEMRAHFANRPAYEGHVVTSSDVMPRDFETLRSTRHYASYAREDILSCPHLIEIANDPRLLQIAQSYLGCPPTIYHINAWWSFAQSGTPAKVSQALHRDIDDFRFVTLATAITPATRQRSAWASWRWCGPARRDPRSSPIPMGCIWASR